MTVLKVSSPNQYWARLRYSFADAMAKTDLRSGLAAMRPSCKDGSSAPEVRIYVIGSFRLCLEVRSSLLELSREPGCRLILLHDVPQEISPLRKIDVKDGP